VPGRDASARRADALACFDAALAAVEPTRLVAEALAGPAGQALGDGPVTLLGLGKAAAAMALGADRALGPRIAGGALAVPKAAGPAPGQLEVVRASHPVPDASSVAAGLALHARAAAAGPDDRLLLLVSGGGSALATLPPAGLRLADLPAVTGRLLLAGAPIGDLNAVRKHLDRLKGGRLARAAAPAPVLALVLSDVVGDPLDVIASGPVSPDPTTWADAISALRRHDAWQSAPPAVRDLLSRGVAGDLPDTPGPGDPCFDTVSVHTVGNARTAAEAARAEAARRGYHAEVVSCTVTGEAREVGRDLARLARDRLSGAAPRPACLVAAGETTVTVRGPGQGGRNQELALSAALALAGEPHVTIASLGTDGVDGPTDAAGAVVDGDTAALARQAGLDPAAALAANDSHTLLKTARAVVATGPTGTNVGDLALVVVA